MSELLTRARRNEIDQVAARLRKLETVGVIAARADAADDVCRAALSPLPAATRVAILDLHRCASPADVAVAFAEAAAGLYVRDPFWLGLPQSSMSAKARGGLVELADAAPELARLVTRPDGVLSDVEPTALVEAAVDAVARLTASGTDAALCFLGAEALSPGGRIRDAHALTWSLRGRLQQAIVSPALLFGGTAPVEALLRDETGALFGWGSLVRLPPDPPVADLAHDLLAEANRPAAAVLGQQIAAVAEGDLNLAGRMVELAMEVDDPDTALDTAWRVVNAGAEPAFPRLLALVAALDRLGVPVLRAVAEGRAPYAVASHPSGPNRTLRRLQSAGLLWQAEDRKWRVTDPLFAAWLRRSTVQGRFGTGRPIVYVLPTSASTFGVFDAPDADALHSSHRSAAAADAEARRLADDVGATVHSFDSTDPRDLPDWFRR